jgi:hypothetical protein
MSLKAQAPPADTNPVRAGDSPAAELDDILDALPDGFVVARHDSDARLVIGPSGAFVLVPLPAARQARDEAAGRVHRLAQETRVGLGEYLAWVPFLDALLVSTGPLVRGAGVTVAPVDLLGAVLRDGPPLIEGPTLATVERVIGTRGLGRWRPASPTGDGRIDLCQPPPSPAVSPR